MLAKLFVTRLVIAVMLLMFSNRSVNHRCTFLSALPFSKDLEVSAPVTTPVGLTLSVLRVKCAANS